MLFRSGVIRFRWVAAGVFVLLLGATYQVYRTVPTGFVPDEDQGYIFVIIQAPQGASLGYTMNIVRQVEDTVKQLPETSRMFAAGGFGFNGTAPNQGVMFLMLKDFKERQGRQHSAQAVVGQLYGRFSRIPGAMVIPFLPPPINGLGQFGGFTYELLDQSGGPIENLQAAAGQFIAEGNRTILSTREYRYYSYYHRIKELLRQYWKPMVEQKMVKVWARGRVINNDEVTTRVLVLLDTKEIGRAHV